MAIDTSATTGPVTVDLGFLPDMEDPTDLRIPGPTPLPPDVVAALGRPMIAHRGPAVKGLFDETLRLLREIHRTSGEVHVWPGTGSTGWEIAIVNVLRPGDAVLATVCGSFGDRFAHVADRLGLRVHRLDVEWGRAITPDLLRDALAEHPDVEAVFLTHNETSTGVTNPLAELGPIVADHGALSFVDAVSGAAALPLEMDAWGLDVVLSGSQKAWMCPPGLTIVGFGPRALARAEALDGSGYPRFSLDLARAREGAKAGGTASTTPLSLVYALRTAVELMATEGIERVWARHARLGQMVRDGLRAQGIALLADDAYASNAVTAFMPPGGTTAKAFQATVHDASGIELAVGQGHLTDVVNRFGHLGWVHEPEIRRTLDAIARATQATSG